MKYDKLKDIYREICNNKIIIRYNGIFKQYIDTFKRRSDAFKQRNNTFRRCSDIFKRHSKVILLIIGMTVIFAFLLIFVSLDKEVQEPINTEIKDAVQCAKCHKRDQPIVIASDTIDISSCYKCHNIDFGFTIPISEQVHAFHQGNISIYSRENLSILSPSDYYSRHKGDDENCENCHIWTIDKLPDCKRCHSKQHIDNNKDNDCLSCHGSLNNIFNHGIIKLETHDIFKDRQCDMCHSKERTRFQLANGKTLDSSKSSLLCKQCHFETYNKWVGGKHLSTVNCVICHNPHSPTSVNMTKVNIIIAASSNDVEKEDDKKEDKKSKEDELEAILRRPSYRYDE